MLKFKGWMAAHGLTVEEKVGEVEGPTAGANGDAAAVSDALPVMQPGDRMEVKELRPVQKFTQPPPRFSEATLVKELEENGIGRPSTYASIIGVLQAR